MRSKWAIAFDIDDVFSEQPNEEFSSDEYTEKFAQVYKNLVDILVKYEFTEMNGNIYITSFGQRCMVDKRIKSGETPEDDLVIIYKALNEIKNLPDNKYISKLNLFRIGDINDCLLLIK